jgi:hypothetical protein
MEKDEDKAPAPVEPEEGKPEKKHGRGRIVLIAAIVLVVLIVLVGAFGGSKKKSDEPFDPSTYESMDYAAVAQNPDSYKDKKLYAKGKIVQVIEGDSETDLRVATATDGYDDIVFVAYDPDILDGAHLTEGSISASMGAARAR